MDEGLIVGPYLNNDYEYTNNLPVFNHILLTLLSHVCVILRKKFSADKMAI